MFNLKTLIRKLLNEFNAPDHSPGTFMVLRLNEVTRLINGVERMHVDLEISIPVLTGHETAQGVKTRNFIAFKNGDTANPLLVLAAQDATAFLSAVLTPLQYGDKLELKMFNVDQAGNVSTTALDGAITLVDTIPPDGPIGAFGYKLTEVADPGDEGQPDANPPAVTTPEQPPVTNPPAVGDGGSSSPPSG